MGGAATLGIHVCWWIVTGTPAVSITGQLRSLPGLPSGSVCACLSLLPQAWGRGDNPGDELEAWHFRDSHPSPAEGPRRCLRHARGFLVLVPCLESAWHADAFAFGKTGTPWSTIWVGGTPEVLLLGFCTAWISDFFPALCVGGGVGVGSLYVKIVPAFSVSICRQARKVIM